MVYFHSKFQVYITVLISHYFVHSEKAVAPQSSTLAWKIPWMEEPGRLQSMGSLRVGHDWATSLSVFTFMHWRRQWQPTPVFLPGESQGWGSLLGCHLWVAQSRTRLSSSSSILYVRSPELTHLITESLYPVANVKKYILLLQIFSRLNWAVRVTLSFPEVLVYPLAWMSGYVPPLWGGRWGLYF